MRRLERQFGRSHPELEGCAPLAPQLEWLQAAFFRLHRRRQHSESGLQPLSHQDMTHFTREVLNLPESSIGMVVRILEATDNAVLFDFYERQREENEKRKK